MIMAGAASFTADDGEARIFLPGDILELADFGGDDLTMAACDQQPVRAAEIGSEPPSQNAAAAPPGTMSEPALPYLRNITGGDDRSHFEDGTMSYSIAGDGSLTTEAIAISGFQYVLASGDLNYDFHNAPQQQIVLPLIGGIRVRNGDGTERELRPGSVFFGEDTTGQGHVPRAVDGEIRFSLFAHLV
ncbi:MAG: hypothetical protein HN608_13060 [Rhodospirillaceae bacterium]|nr:hypothetical protein [Rhodospirillaceae bacterium]